MGTLTGQQINNTYDGLLKLADSTTGITQNLQAVQDGLGNNTGLRIAKNQLEVPNIPGYVSLKGQYYGSVVSTTATQQNANGTQNIILAQPFYDSGLYNYSALTYNVVTATTSSDSVEAAIYTSQLSNPYGLCPYEPIISGLTIDVSSTGFKDIVFGSPISMSGYGGGIYWVVWKITNANVQPTVRFGGGFPQVGSAYFQVYGLALQVNGFYSVTPRLNGNFAAYSGTTTFDNPYSASLPTTQSSLANIAGSAIGILLHTI
jgi:hypothetical protein